jgi:hypothetical protein
MKKVTSVLAILAIGMFVGTAFAQVETTVFGPEKYVRAWGKPNVYHGDFSSASEKQGAIILGRLVVKNGPPRGGWRHTLKRVRSAWIQINGCTVLGPDHFKSWAHEIVVPVRLKTQNTLSVELAGIPGSYLTVEIEYETGPMGPIFTGPKQYPFLCRTEEAGLGQPLIDNHDQIGIPIYGRSDIVGYSKDCSIPSRMDYFYKATDGKFKRLGDFTTRPADLVQATTMDGLTVDYIVRVERGTIDRFIYGIAMLAPLDIPFAKCPPAKKGKAWGQQKRCDPCDMSWDTSAWNGKLVYQFQGGVGIGHQQGSGWATNMINEDKDLADGGPIYDQALAAGYAVAFSTGTTTDTHYNLNLSAKTMRMVKEHFIARYGKPVYTVGVGGSGGSIQQYHIGQNYPGLLDGGVPQYSYSDMVTQAIYVGDCSLLEFYFDAVAPGQGDFTFGGLSLADKKTKIGSVLPRTWIEGMSSNDDMEHSVFTPLSQMYGGNYAGSTECVEGWLGLLPLCINPLWTSTEGVLELPADVREPYLETKWTHWDDLKTIYGEDPSAPGYAPNTWDNVGVQYGLQALKDGNITLAQFLHINAAIGGWKRPWEMVPEGYPFSAWNTIRDPNIPPNPMDFDPWSIRNATFNGALAARTEGSIEAMHRAYRSGHVFIGKLHIPVIDFRHYLDPVLNMHHAQQSFATRQRLVDGQGHADNQLIWFAAPFYDLTMAAIELLDEWIYNIQHKVKGEGVVANKPDDALDLCVDAAGNLIGKGSGAWAGILDNEAPGLCTEAFPLYSTSRIAAGGDIKGDVFKCHLIPVEEAVARGFYDPVQISDSVKAQLSVIFPTGVCDYSQGDMGRPDNL